MDVLDVTKLKRRPEVIKQAIAELGTSYVAKENLRIIYPERYVNKKMVIYGDPVVLLCLFIVVNEKDEYALLNLPIHCNVSPSKITEVSVNGSVNKVLHIDKGNKLIEDSYMIIKSAFLFEMFNEFFMNGNVPWYLTDVDLSKISKETAKVAGSKIGDDTTIWELLTAIIARDSDDITKPYRLTDKKKPPVFVGFMDIYYSFDNTLDKVAGSYFKAGITAALVNKNKVPTTLEKVVRSGIDDKETI